LFDNLFLKEILHTLTSSSSNPQSMAQRLARDAHSAARDRSRHTPFAEAAKKAGQFWEGGKMDDISVIVARIAMPGSLKTKL
jgi:protein phosphatase PTC7